MSTISMVSQLDGIAANLARRQQHRQEAFEELVRQLASEDQPPSDDDAEAILAGAGKTLADLEAAVKTRRQRLALRAQLDTVPALEAERLLAESEVAEAGRIFELAAIRHRDVTAPLQQRLQEVQNATTAAHGAGRRLRETAPAQLKEQLADLNRRRDAAHEKATAWASEIAKLEGKAAAGRDHDSRNQTTLYAAEAAGLEAQALRGREQLAEFRAGFGALDAEVTALMQQLLVP
jgi:hypothetical protein